MHCGITLKDLKIERLKMKITDKGQGQFVIIPDTETLEDIGTAIIMASYELARPFGFGMMRQHETELTKEMALKMLEGEDISQDYAINTNKPLHVYMDYVFGKCCKTQIKLLPFSVEVYISTNDRDPVAILKRAKEILTQ